MRSDERVVDLDSAGSIGNHKFEVEILTKANLFRTRFDTSNTNKHRNISLRHSFRRWPWQIDGSHNMPGNRNPLPIMRDGVWSPTVRKVTLRSEPTPCVVPCGSINLPVLRAEQTNSWCGALGRVCTDCVSQENLCKDLGSR